MEKRNNNLEIKDVFGDKFEDYTAGNGRTYKGWITKYPILKTEEVNNWLSSKMRKFSVKGKKPEKFQCTNYLNTLQKYCDYYDATPKELLQEENVSIRNDTFMAYISELLQNGNNEATVKNNTQSRIGSFYKYYGKNITEQLETVTEGTTKRSIFEIDLSPEDVYSIERRLIKAEYKLILKIQSQLGLRISDVLETLVSEKKTIINNKTELEATYKIEKNEEGYYFIRSFKTNKKGVIINYLFFPNELTNEFGVCYPDFKEDLRKLDLRTILMTSYGKRISATDYGARIKKASQDVGLNGGIGSHMLRKFHENRISDVDLSILKIKGMSPEFSSKFKTHLEGHTQEKKLVNAYITKLKNVDKFFQWWKPLEEALSINVRLVNLTEEKTKENTEKIDSIQDKYNTLLTQFNEKNAELTELKAKIPEMVNDAIKTLEERLTKNFESKFMKQVDPKILDEFNDSK